MTQETAETPKQKPENPNKKVTKTQKPENSLDTETGRELIFSSTVRRKNEKKFGFIRRVVFHNILVNQPVIALPQLIKEIERVIEQRVDRAYLLATLVFPDSGLIIEGDILYYTVLTKEQLLRIRYRAKSIIDQSGGEIKRTELLRRIRRHFMKKEDLYLGTMLLETYLFHRRTKFRCVLKGGNQEMVSHSYTYTYNRSKKRGKKTSHKNTQKRK